MVMSLKARGLTLLGVVALAGCGARAGGASGLDGPGGVVPGTSGRSCAFVMDADEVPRFDDLVRIGTRGSLSLWGRRSGVGDSVELSIRYDEEGRLTWVQTLTATMEPLRVAELERLVRSAIREEGPEDWGVRIRFVEGRVDAVLPSVMCAPVRAAGGQGSAAIPMGSRSEVAELYSAIGRRFRVEVALDERGRVVGVRIPHSSGSRLLDQYAVDVARGASYEPKLHDGIGVPSVLSVSVAYGRRRI